MKTLFDVVIYEIETGVIHSIIGENLPNDAAERRQLTGLGRINDMFDCAIVAAGKYKKGDQL